MVVSAHGSGSSRHSPRNQFVARQINAACLATPLFGLLTPDEAFDRANVFDIELLADRLRLVTHWLHCQPECTELGIGYFGASTGLPRRCGQPLMIPPSALWSRAVADQTSPHRALGTVRAPTLLIVGGRDVQVLELNRQAADKMSCEHRIEIVPGATHLFEESGTPEIAARLAHDWFVHYLAPARSLSG